MSHARRYAQSSAQTASRERLMVMLFEKALQGMRSGAAALEAGRAAEANRALSNALDIVVELHATLDREKAPELCDRLGEVYRFVCARVGDANLTRDPRLAREAERAFAPVADGFARAVASLGPAGAR
jgi:flagellar protein FliS